MNAKFRIMSDLHLEFQKSKISKVWTPSPHDRDQILILAGDIDVGGNGTDCMLELCSHFKHVVRILGNHEFYDREYHGVIEFWRVFEQSQSPSNFHFLHNDSRVLDGVKIIGGTMWTGFDNADPFVMMNATNTMTDYNVIRYGSDALVPAIILEKHREFMDYLKSQLATQHQLPIVVVTHHSPGNAVRRSTYTSGNALYYADLEQLVGDSRINLWVHGHTHSSQDYYINQTRVICNPYGYHGHGINAQFDPQMVMEIS